MDRIGKRRFAEFTLTFIAGIATVLLLPTLAFSAPELAPRFVAPKALYGTVSRDFHRHDRVIVKFVEGSSVRLRGGQLVSLTQSVDLTELDIFLRDHPDITIARHFQRSERELNRAKLRGQVRSGKELANLNLYYRFVTSSDSNPESLERTLSELHQLACVETAFAEPKAELANLNDTKIEVGQGANLPLTPDFSAMQGYLYDSPSGINADKVWAYPGGRGAGVKLIDIEGDWRWTHEDLSPPFFNAGTPIDGWRNHGTAVIGEIIGSDNDLGIIGIASDVELGGISFADFGVAGAIDLAAANLDEGDIFLIELHGAGPDSKNGSGQYGYMPMEWWQDNFDAIQTAVANGRICVEAGGNGEQDLDSPLYSGLFDRNVRDSGAVLVGAGTPNLLDAEWFTNYGSRIDLNGWGSAIVTTGYGTFQGGDEDEWYIAGFGGTSGASPIICGAIACLQGMSKATWGITIDGGLAVQILRQSGSAYTGSKAIGRRPNLEAARGLLVGGIGQIHGVVRDATSGEPVADAAILVQSIDSGRRSSSEESRRNDGESRGGGASRGSGGRVTRTGPDGSFRIPLLSGPYSVEVESFFHETATSTFSLGSGQSLSYDIDLTARPASNLSGSVFAAGLGTPISGVGLALVQTPVPSEVTDGSGAFDFTGLPTGESYQLVVGPTPGRQGATAAISHSGASAPLIFELEEAESFEDSDGGYVGDPVWAWGAPISGNAYSGTQLWATNLNGDYGSNLDDALTSPSFDVEGLDEVLLSFNHWYDTERSYDGGQVEVYDGESWALVHPIGGYPDVNIAALDWTPGFSGESIEWTVAVFDVTPYASADFRFRFRFASDSGTTDTGWLIEDVYLTPLPDPASTPRVPDRTFADRSVSAFPNPFRQSIQIVFELAEAGPVILEVFDVVGRRIAVRDAGAWSAGPQIFDWDGTDAKGQNVGTGVLFYRLRLQDKVTQARQLLRLR